MNTMNIKPAYQYRFRNVLKSIGVFYGIMILVLAGTLCLFLYLTSRNGDSSGNFSGFAFAASIMTFVLGISTIREDIRLMLQNGIGRRTVFAMELLAVLSASLILAVAGELLTSIGQAITANMSQFDIFDFYQIFFTDMSGGLSFGQHLESIALTFSIYTCAGLSGIFISLLFYRLNKMWTLIVAIGAPLMLTVGLPIALSSKNRIGRFLVSALGGITEFAISSPWKLILCLLLSSVIVESVNWLMMRRAPVKPVK